MRHWLVSVVVLSATLSWSSYGLAQTIGETVEKHVDDELKKTEDADKRKKEQRRQEEERKKKDEKEKKSEQPTAEKKSPEKDPHKKSSKKPPAAPKELTERQKRNAELPKRVIHKWIELDPEVGIGYRGWLADQYPALQVKYQNYLMWTVGMRGRFFRAFRVYRAAYESTGFSSPRNKGYVIAEKAVKAAPGAAAKALGMLGAEVNFVLVPILRYETRAYEATALPQRPVRIIPFSASRNDMLDQYPLTENDLSAISTFETLVIGMHYNDKYKRTEEQIARNPNPLSYYFGVGLVRYAKPYQVRVGDGVLDELVFNGRFRGAGLSLGFDLPGGIEKLSVNLEADVGLGEIRLLHDMTLNQLLPSDWLMGYARGSLKLGYTYPLLRTKPTLLLAPEAVATGATFFYFNTSGDSSSTPMANWDLLWSGMAKLILPL